MIPLKRLYWIVLRIMQSDLKHRLFPIFNGKHKREMHYTAYIDIYVSKHIRAKDDTCLFLWFSSHNTIKFIAR